MGRRSQIQRIEIIPNDLELAYMAGIVDGEGTLSIGYYSSAGRRGPIQAFRPSVEVSNTNAELMLWIRARFGGTIHPARRNGVAAHAKPIFKWWCGGYDRIGLFLDQIQPYLLLKRAQASLLREFIGTKAAGGHTMSEATLSHRLAITDSMRLLNRRGVA